MEQDFWNPFRNTGKPTHYIACLDSHSHRKPPDETPKRNTPAEVVRQYERQARLVSSRHKYHLFSTVTDSGSGLDYMSAQFYILFF